MSFFRRAVGGEYEAGSGDRLERLLGQMAKNKLIDRTRQELAAKRGGDRVELADEVDAPAGGPTPSQAAMAREEAEAVRDRFTPDEWAVVVLRAVEGLAWAEAGARLGTTADAARVRFDRAVQRVRNERGAGADGRRPGGSGD